MSSTEESQKIRGKVCDGMKVDGISTKHKEIEPNEIHLLRKVTVSR
jgi:hypothetical protein